MVSEERVGTRDWLKLVLSPSSSLPCPHSGPEFLSASSQCLVNRTSCSECDNEITVHKNKIKQTAVIKTGQVCPK